MSTTFNIAGLIVCRVGLGVFEAGFGPAVPLYLCKRLHVQKHLKRVLIMAFFFRQHFSTPKKSLVFAWRTGSALPPSQGPLVASLPSPSNRQISSAAFTDTIGNSSSSLKVYILFLHHFLSTCYPGVPAFCLGIFTIFFLPDRPETTSYLKDGPERQLAVARMNRGTQAEVAGTVNTSEYLP